MNAPAFAPGERVRIHAPGTIRHGKEGTVLWVERWRGFTDWVGVADEWGGLWPTSALALRRRA